MIRDANTSDIPDLISLGRVMHRESPNYRRMSFNPDRLAATLTIAIGQGFARVVDRSCVGIIGGMFALLTPHWFSDDTVSSDIALFIDPEWRGGMAAPMLIREYGRWAQSQGAKKIMLGVTTGVDEDATRILCERLGWRRTGIVMEIDACA